MRVIKILLSTLLFFIPLSKGYTQTTTTINYTSSGLSTSVCNVFNVGSSPQNIGGLDHFPIAGGVSYDGTFIKLQAMYGTSTSTNYGTVYLIKYPFKKNHTYTIKVTGKSSSNSYNANVTVGYSNSIPNTGANADCGEVQESHWTSLLGLTFSYQYLSGTSSEHTMAASTPSENYDYLSIIATGITEGQQITALISKIVIEDVAPVTTSFSVTPGSVIKTCGTSINQTFTVNGSNIPGGATVTYSWDLGLSSNRWYYGGSPAPQTISTGSTNSITLTDASCDEAPTNITVTAIVNGTSYPAGSVTVSSSPFSIDGPRYICSGTTSSTYSITNLGCSPTVSWSVSPSGLVTVNNSSSTTTTLTYVSSGEGTLTATYSSPCGSGTLSIPITSGSPVPKAVSTYFTNYGYGTSPYLTSQYVFLGTNHGYTGDNNATFNYYVSDPLFSGLSWSVVSQPSGTNYQTVDNTNWMYVVMNGCTNCALAITMNLSGTGPCGTYSQNITSTAARISGYGYRAALFPNPASSFTTVSLEPIDPKSTNTVSGSRSLISSKPLIKKIEITNQLGVNMKTFNYKSGVSNIRIPLSGIPSGIYTMSVFDGVNWTSQQLVIK